ncbi:deoxycytidyl transferase [Serendipita sp. 398]|nr:deoxycytidyl transferase [Serendipita sp. 398]
MAMASSQTTTFFGDDEEGFEDALKDMELDTPRTAARATTPTPASRKRKASQTGDEILDINTYSLATMKRDDDPEDIYGASSFGGYGQYMRRKRAKLQIQNRDMSKIQSDVLRGVEIYINGHTEPSAQVLREIIVGNGGKFHAYLTNKSLVTHIIAMNLTPAKVKEYKRMKVVRPEWILESVKAGELLPWIDFKLVMDDRIDTGQGGRVAQANLSFDKAINPQRSPVTQTPKPIDNVQEEIKEPLYMTDPVTMEQAARIPSYAFNKSNQAAQRLMSRPGWREEHTAVSGAKFIEGYYQNSRLHHLSMWKAELKDLVAKARERSEVGDYGQSSNETTSPVLLHGVSMKDAELVKSLAIIPSKKGKESVVEQVYMHCDFDCFFVSAGLLYRPDLRGKPVVVCHSQGMGEGIASTSEIASSSYEARESGIRNGMSLGQARQLCPEVQTLPYEFEKYKELSLKFYTVLLSFSDELQPVSVDEALLDVSNTVANLKAQTLAENPSAVTIDFTKQLAELIRAKLLQMTGCQISIGIGENLLLSRIASRAAKPAGVYRLTTADAPGFLAPLPLDAIWGVGYSIKKKAEERLRITKISDIESHSKGTLIKVFGPAMTDRLMKAAKGLDDTKLQPDQKRKSVSAEINFGIRFENNAQAELFMQELGEEVSSRLKAIDMKGRQLTLKVMKRHPNAPVEPPKFMGHGICDTFSKSCAIADDRTGNATSDAAQIGDAAWSLLESLQFDPKELRGLGLQVTKLEAQYGNSVQEGKLEFGQQRLDFGSPGGTSPSNQAVDDQSFQAEVLTEGTIDQEVLEALPEDIRQEIISRLGGASSSRATIVIEDDHLDAQGSHTKPQMVGVSEAAANVSKEEVTEVRVATSMKNVAHITRQLRPKVKSQLSPMKNQLFAQRKDAFTTPEELAELDLDPEVFFQLPIELQKEQLKHARSLRKGINGDRATSVNPEARSRAQTPTATTKRVKFGFGDGFGRLFSSPSSKPLVKRSDFKLKATYPEDIALYVGDTGKDQKSGEAKWVKLTDVGDIQGQIRRWVAASRAKGAEPVSTDIEGLKDWLLRCMSMKESHTGMEKAVVILKWWRELLRTFWEVEQPLPGKRTKEVENLERLDSEDSLGRAWWLAFTLCKTAVDEVSKARFGGKLSLR